MLFYRVLFLMQLPNEPLVAAQYRIAQTAFDALRGLPVKKA
jgi:hypothetical protein